jgi:hypothetical protein
MRRLVPFLIPCVLSSGCFGGEGLEVPTDEIYFPLGLAIDSAGKHLYVVSSDFDLQYDGGSVQSYRLDDLYAKLPQRCATDADCGDGKCNQGMCSTTLEDSPCPQGDRPPEDWLLYPGRCNFIDNKPFIASKVKIGAFATDAVIRTEPNQTTEDPTALRQRLFVPVRGDTTLHWMDLQNGQIECGQSNNAGACDSLHRAGQSPARENTRDLSLAAEPFGIDANDNGSTLVVTNQTSGTASLFVNDWNEPKQGPYLKFALSSSNMPSRPIGIAHLPRRPEDKDPDALTTDAFLMTFRNAAQVRLLRYAPDGADADADPTVEEPEGTNPRPYLVDGGGVIIDANSVGADSRGLAVDRTAREKATAACGSDEACIEQAALIPLDVYVANRSPATLLIGRTQPPLEYPYFFQTVPLTVGPSRVVVGQIPTPSGELETRAFVVSFDSRRVFIIDPKRLRIEVEIMTGRGPQALAIDAPRRLLYVGHFTDSWIGVYSLDLASPASYGTLIGSLGFPKAPRSSK